MRIISGEFGGRIISGPSSFLTRPVSDKVKGAIFNILGNINGTRVLDIFAGTGSVGLEALSRGADQAVFVESLPATLNCLRKNIDTLGVSERTQIFRGRAPKILEDIARRYPPFPIVFIDPPYDQGLVNRTLTTLKDFKLVDAFSTLIIEHSPREKPLVPGFKLTDERHYGQTWVSFLQLDSEAA